MAACDGIRSSIRDTFFPANQKPKYSGYSAWRGIGKSALKSIHFALGPKGHVVSYPINNDGDVSFVAVRKEDFQFMTPVFFLSLKMEYLCTNGAFISGHLYNQ